ncbi:vegetative cell wall protein gp1 [Panicum miliaceum]|uniref:Vegetative cell wall protein gp1 n=1 Tax=Panicum miliaceum TaxID=4540 RepID=A0A3L6QGR2_PANMI|nr:vegetative cell wall protein gp1 [Panicum miliaceum]
MATAVLRSHDALNNRMHLDAFTPSPTKPRRRRSPKPAGASSPPHRAAAVASPAPKAAAGASPPVKAAAAGRRSPPARPAARKQPSPTKEKPKQRLVMEEVRILKRGEEPPAPAPAPAPVLAAPLAKAAAAVDQRALCSTGRIGPQAPAVVPTKKIMADAAGYAGPAFAAAAPEPSSLPMPAFFLRRAETEATRGLRCLLRIGELA